MVKVNSSFIESYEVKDKTMTIAFKDGKKQDYNVSDEAIVAFEDAIKSNGSIGRLFNSMIKS